MSEKTSPLADYKKISVSLIATVLDEASSILALLKSYKQQIILAQEFIIVDAGSKDDTRTLVATFAKENPQLRIQLLDHHGSNRSQARNLAVSKAKGEYIAFCDAGCVLDSHWLSELLLEREQSGTEVVGGFFQGLSRNNFEAAVVPYFLQMPKKLSAANFVPTTRSLLIAKKVYEKLGGLNERLELSEDYEFMLRLKSRGISWSFAKDALVFWFPPQNLSGFLRKISGFAKSDIEAGIVRPKVLSIYARYALLCTAFFLAPLFGLFLLFVYLLWSIAKNYHNCSKSLSKKPHSAASLQISVKKSVFSPQVDSATIVEKYSHFYSKLQSFATKGTSWIGSQAWHYLPLLQLSSDVAIMTASLLALKNFRSRAF